MLYKTFDSLKEAHGEDYFTSRVEEDVYQNLNPKFQLREYQKEAFGRFDFYFTEYRGRKFPTQLLFHMATGSGKTLIMAGAILYLYKQGYRNFIFFVNSKNIIEKTKDNFLNPLSDKYLFAPKIKFGEKDVFIREVENFEAAHPEDINILFTTIQGLHQRLKEPKENQLTAEEFEEREIVLISDEAHHLQVMTKTKEEQNIEENWEATVMKKIFTKNSTNLLLEFTATIDLTNENIQKKYEDKLIFQYDLKQFRQDKYSKEIEVLEADLGPMERALQAVILSQYRRKIAEKNKVYLKPVILFKSKTIKESADDYTKFLTKIQNLSLDDIEGIQSRAKGTILEKVFDYLQKEGITFANFIKELQEDFSPEKVMLLNSENIDEEKQLKLNSLESVHNEIRAIFAVNMLNEGWDVLNLFDIVRLYDTRDGKWVGGKYKPGNTTIGEAQLIGRGARYFPFQIKETDDKFKRKFDNDIENEMRIVEILHYHSAYNPRYIDEIKNTLTEMGIIPEKYVEVDLFVKDSFKKTDLWQVGVIFLNEREENKHTDVYSLDSAKIEKNYTYTLRTGEMKEEILLDEEKFQLSSDRFLTIKRIKLPQLGKNVVRTALDKLEFYRFDALKKYFPHIKSIEEFITSEDYLGGVQVEIMGPENRVAHLSQREKLEIALSVAKSIAERTKTSTSAFKGTCSFKAKLLKEIFQNKKIKIATDELEREKLQNINLAEKDWYAQNDFYGTDEEQKFILFIESWIERLKQKYTEVVLFRNEKFFQIYDFEEGRAFEPDFLMLLKGKDGVITMYQVFIEAKGDQFKDSQGRFENSKEGWKQDFLLSLENEAKVEKELFPQNGDFRIIGLPFYNEGLKKEFEKAFEEKMLDEGGEVS
ncbi:DEAD/DEAH box helicase family protein [Thermospira aquatica]|uniref:DEAD/DEAH box helicase family protein n=1 Tax=Thermospira aquatica TaxID=2828656 RepID=A0AAX3BAE6_9SPIR|nr:DEAD/DEAH box helicase family protein [Thermospira aquatica]URA09247.1 DEAD/DEAH box helicase family protein [Thermospira aquatica]